MGEMIRWPSPSDLFKAAMSALFPRERMQVPKRQTAYTYVDGPMYYLGQQIVKAMQDAGYPAKILWCYRSPEIQRGLYAQGRTAPGRKVTNAKPWDSPHQYFEAVDIIHPSLGWQVSEDYWEALASCVRIVADKFGVELDHGHTWRFRDSAHIQLKDWKTVRDRHRRQVLDEGLNRPPNEAELWFRFCEVLPSVAADLGRR